jgi:hypothetical protein
MVGICLQGYSKGALQLNAKLLGSFIPKFSEFEEVLLLILVPFRRQKKGNIFETVRGIFCRPVYSKNTGCSGKGLT